MIGGVGEVVEDYGMLTMDRLCLLWDLGISERVQNAFTYYVGSSV